MLSWVDGRVSGCAGPANEEDNGRGGGRGGGVRCRAFEDVSCVLACS